MQNDHTSMLDESLSTGKKGATAPRQRTRDALPEWFGLIAHVLRSGEFKPNKVGATALLFGDNPIFANGVYEPGDAMRFRATKAEIEEFLRDERKDAQSGYRQLLDVLSARGMKLEVVIEEHRHDHRKLGEPSTRTWRTLALELRYGEQQVSSHT